MAAGRQCHARRRRLVGHTTGGLAVVERRGVNAPEAGEATFA